MRVIQSVKRGVKTLYIKGGVLKWYSMSVIQCEGCEGGLKSLYVKKGVSGTV